MRAMEVGKPITTIPIPLQAYGITNITTMYRYLHKRNHLCSKNKLILSKKGNKQLAKKRETEKSDVMDHTSYNSPGCIPVKNYFRSWISAEVEQLFC